MIKKNPKVSIIIPVYNGSDYMKYAIDSALAQTYKNIEVIVVNDGSKDNGKTKKVAKEYGNKIRYFEKENGGVSTALNLAIENMKGDYFSWLSHDDEYLPTKIEEQLKMIDENEKTIIISDFYTINESGNITGTIKMNKKNIEKSSYYQLFEGNLNGITLLIPKKAFEEVGLFDESLRCTQDYDLWYKMLNKGYKFKCIEKCLAKSRQHPNQTTYLSPNTLKEGNKLWISMIKSIPKKEKEKMYKTEYSFYLSMLKKMYLSNYNDAYNYVKEILIKENKDKKAQIIIKDINIKVEKVLKKNFELIKRALRRSPKENIKKISQKLKG